MPVQYKDYYATLGVAKTASHDDIRKAFRKLARQYHPDVAKDKKTAESKFKEINEAYEVLGDDDKRKRYDELGADWEHGPQQTPPGWNRGGGGSGQGFGGFGNGGEFSGTGFSDFFEQFFGGAAGRGGGAQGFPGFGGQQAPARGSDIEADLLVTIEETLHGAKKKISFRRDGKSDVETYEVRIPKGVREGQKIRLAGQGEAGRRGQAGDLYLVVRFEKHPDYTIDGSDLVYDLEVPVWQAVLGDNLSIPTPDGPVRLKIPDCSQPGKKFRIKGRGLPTGPTTRGDFYVRLVVQLPTDLTPEQRAQWEKLSRT